MQFGAMHHERRGALASTGGRKMLGKTEKIRKEKILRVNFAKILKISKSFFRIHEEISGFRKKLYTS